MLTIEQIAGIITASLGVLTLVRPIRRGLVKIWHNTLGRSNFLLKEIKTELVNNGGQSLKDIIVRIEEKQIAIDAFLRAQLNIHNVAIVRTDASGKLFACNRAYQHMTGASLAEVQGDGWINVIHPEDRTRVKKLWQLAVEEQREFHEIIRFKNAEGLCFSANANVYKEIDALGKLRGYLGVITPLCEDECPFAEDCTLKCTHRDGRK